MNNSTNLKSINYKQMKHHHGGCMSDDTCSYSEEETIQTLSEFNKWRRSDESIEQPNPTKVGLAIDNAIGIIAYLRAERDEANRLARFYQELNEPVTFLHTNDQIP